MINRLKSSLQIGVLKLTGHDIAHIHSFADFVEFMYLPVDGSSLAMGRILFGLLMLVDIPEERGGSILDIRYGKATNCYFPLISFVQPLSASKMGIIYGLLWLGALGVALGFKFRLSSAMFVSTYWYIFLLDKSVWNNHSYLYGLCGILFMFSSSHRNFSIDAWKSMSGCRHVPFWNYAIIKYQFCILYTVAGLKKLSSEWLSGYAMMNLSYHWVFWPLRKMFGTEFTDLFIIHWFVCIFDMTIIFWIIYQPTRKIATMICVLFHLMNSRLFSIGMFPWVCLAELPLFYERNWPKLWFRTSSKGTVSKSCGDGCQSTIKKPKFKQKAVVLLTVFYCFGQAFLPYSHFITKGYNGWTDGPYGYSWDMMVHAWDTTLTVIQVIDHTNNRRHYLNPNAFAVNDRWTKHPDMAYQYAQCIKRNLMEDVNDASVQVSQNFSIYFDAWSSLNSRFQQRMFDPSLDMLGVEWSLFQSVPWMKPLLHQFTSKRMDLQQIATGVLGWSNFSDVLFLADFPGHVVENFISAELDNVTLTVLNGVVEYQSELTDGASDVETGQSIQVDSGTFHKVTTLSRTPSCFMYTFVNRTMRSFGTERRDTNEPILPIDMKKGCTGTVTLSETRLPRDHTAFLSREQAAPSIASRKSEILNACCQEVTQYIFVSAK